MKESIYTLIVLFIIVFGIVVGFVLTSIIDMDKAIKLKRMELEAEKIKLQIYRAESDLIRQRVNYNYYLMGDK